MENGYFQIEITTRDGSVGYLDLGRPIANIGSFYVNMRINSSYNRFLFLVCSLGNNKYNIGIAPISSPSLSKKISYNSGIDAINVIPGRFQCSNLSNDIFTISENAPFTVGGHQLYVSSRGIIISDGIDNPIVSAKLIPFFPRQPILELDDISSSGCDCRKCVIRCIMKCIRESN